MPPIEAIERLEGKAENKAHYSARGNVNWPEELNELAHMLIRERICASYSESLDYLKQTCPTAWKMYNDTYK